MIGRVRGNGGPSPRVLMLSHRNIYEQEVWRCSFREFEGVVREIDSVDVVAPQPTNWYRHRKRVALRFGRHVALPLNPGIEQIELDRTYDLFVTICEKPSELLNIAALKNWKEHCKTSICWLPEFYVSEIPLFKSCVQILSQFDHVILMFSALEPFEKALGRPCRYLPAGIDALEFCPFPSRLSRSIDVLSIGRRSEETHQALLKMQREGELFYLFDTLSDLHTRNLDQHRFLMANLAKRSRTSL